MSNNTKAKQLKLATIFTSYIIFLMIWTIYTFFGDFAFPNEFINWLLGFMVHTLCWPTFALFLIHRFNLDLNVQLKKMLTTFPKLTILLPLLLVAFAYNFLCWKLNPAGFGNTMKAYDLIITIGTVGFFEEILFRGWFQNALSHFVSEPKANLIAAALFVFVHYPKWISHGYSPLDLVIRSMQIYALGLIFGWIFRKTKSIWGCTILHSFWDALVFLL